MNRRSFWSKIIFLIINYEKGKDFSKIRFKRQVKDILNSMLIVKSILQSFINDETITSNIVERCLKHKHLKRIINNTDFIEMTKLETLDNSSNFNESHHNMNISMLLIVEDIISLLGEDTFKTNHHKVKKLLYSIHNLPRIYFDQEGCLNLASRISINQAIEYGKMSLSEEEKDRYFPFLKPEEKTMFLKFDISYLDLKSQPGFFEGFFYDAFGNKHIICDKIPIIFNKVIIEENEVPKKGYFISGSIKEIKDKMILFKLDYPLETTEDKNTFYVLKEQLRNKFTIL